MKNSVGRTTRDADDNHGVLERFTRENVAWSDVLFEQVLDSATCCQALEHLRLGVGRVG